MVPSTLWRRLASALHIIAANNVFYSRTAYAVQNLCTKDTLLDLPTADSILDLDAAHLEPELLIAYARMLDQQSHSTFHFPLSVLEDSKPDLRPWHSKLERLARHCLVLMVGRAVSFVGKSRRQTRTFVGSGADPVLVVHRTLLL